MAAACSRGGGGGLPLTRKRDLLRVGGSGGGGRGRSLGRSFCPPSTPGRKASRGVEEVLHIGNPGLGSSRVLPGRCSLVAPVISRSLFPCETFDPPVIAKPLAILKHKTQLVSLGWGGRPPVFRPGFGRLKTPLPATALVPRPLRRGACRGGSRRRWSLGRLRTARGFCATGLPIASSWISRTGSVSGSRCTGERGGAFATL